MEKQTNIYVLNNIRNIIYINPPPPPFCWKGPSMTGLCQYTHKLVSLLAVGQQRPLVLLLVLYKCLHGTDASKSAKKTPRKFTTFFRFKRHSFN